MKLRLSLILLAVSFFLVNITKAQTDSTHFDLGRILANKNFTQGITVKGSDLERYQFNYITDALNVFFYGTYTNSSSVVYVIDGNIVNDVNAYSIQDVEEITLVENAMAQVNGAAPFQQLVLIKTRRGGPGKQGIVASNQTSLVDARNNNNYSNAYKPSGIYEQAYLGGYRNYTNADIGISAGFLRNVSPQVLPGTYAGTDPFYYNQFRLNAYTDVKVWKGSTLSFAVNYTSDPGGYGNVMNINTPTTVNDFTSRSRETQHLFNTNIALRSHIAGGLTNTFSAGYNHYNDFERSTGSQYVNNTQFGYSGTYSSLLTWQQQAHTLLFKDNLVYHQQAGDWSIDPSLNFMYRRLKDTLGIFETTSQDSSLNIPYAYQASQKADYKLSLLTPSLDIYYKNIFDIQEGFTAILNKENFGPNFPVSHILPFVSASLNISELARLQSIKLKVFASFSRQNDFLDDPFVSLSMFTLQGFENPIGAFTGTSVPFAGIPYNISQSYNNYQAGFMLGMLKGFTISYSLRENYNGTIAEYPVPSGANGSELLDVYESAKAIMNSIALNYSLQTAKFGWETGLNATSSKLQVTDQSSGQPANQYLASGHRWSGGFTNRVSYNDLFAGVNILYQIGQRPYSLAHWQVDDIQYIPPSNNNSFSLYNLYLGTKLKIEGLKYAEVYINTRNMLQNKSSDITDERRFYGFGFKVNW